MRCCETPVRAAVALEAGVRVGIGDAPIDDLADRIVRAGVTPGARGALVDRHVAPGVAARLAGRGGDVELPNRLPGLRVVRRDEAELALALLAGAVGDHLAVGDENAARLVIGHCRAWIPSAAYRSWHRAPRGIRRAPRSRSCPGRCRGSCSRADIGADARRDIGARTPTADRRSWRRGPGCWRQARTGTSRRDRRSASIPAMPAGRPRDQAMRSWPTLALLIWLSGLKRCWLKVRLMCSQSAGSGLASTWR